MDEVTVICNEDPSNGDDLETTALDLTECAYSQIWTHLGAGRYGWVTIPNGRFTNSGNIAAASSTAVPLTGSSTPAGMAMTSGAIRAPIPGRYQYSGMIKVSTPNNFDGEVNFTMTKPDGTSIVACATSSTTIPLVDSACAAVDQQMTISVENTSATDTISYELSLTANWIGGCC